MKCLRSSSHVLNKFAEIHAHIKEDRDHLVSLITQSRDAKEGEIRGSDESLGVEVKKLL